jgi:hypothetical protein
VSDQHKHHANLDPLAFAVAAYWAVNANNEMRQVQADLAVLQNARAIRAVHAATGFVSSEQMQTLYVAEQIEKRVAGWRANNDARVGKRLSTTVGWVVAIAVLLTGSAIPGVNAFVLWVAVFIGGGLVYVELEKRRIKRLVNRREITGIHSHGSGGAHSHPQTRRHRHYGDIDGPMY